MCLVSARRFKVFSFLSGGNAAMRKSWHSIFPTQWSYARASELRDVEQSAAFHILLRDHRVMSRRARLKRALDIALLICLPAIIFTYPAYMIGGLFFLFSGLIFVILLPLRYILFRFVPGENFLGVLSQERLRELNLLPITDADYASALWAWHVRVWPARKVLLPLFITLVAGVLGWGLAGERDLLILLLMPIVVMLPSLWLSFAMRYRALPYSALTEATAQAAQELADYQKKNLSTTDVAREGVAQSVGNFALWVFAIIVFAGFSSIWSAGLIGRDDLSSNRIVLTGSLMMAICLLVFYSWNRWTIGFDRESASGYFRSMSRDLGQLRRWLLVDADKAKPPDQS